VKTTEFANYAVPNAALAQGDLDIKSYQFQLARWFDCKPGD